MAKILVTGAGGFIGNHLANYLADSGHEVTGVDLHFPESSADGKPFRFEAVPGDFRKAELIRPLLSGSEYVFHLASAHLQISLPESEYWDINVHSLRPFLSLAKGAGVKRFIHVSSVGLYGNLREWPANEESPANPQSIYGETKLAGEAEVMGFYRETHFPVVIIRPAWVYGPGCPRTLKIYRTMLSGKFVMIGKGDNLRHPVFIADMLQAFRLAMEKQEAVGETFIIGGEEYITTRDLIGAFVEVLGAPKPRIKLPYFLGHGIAVAAEAVFGILKKEPPISTRSLEFFNTNNAFDIQKAKKILGFKPEYSFSEGLQATRAWLHGQVIQK